ncbi:MAG: ATP-grasp domain-containing protein [Chloroflexi bacterium]|nr:ATP-grasp domain-containing protein [Chloroflexota bacterium]
MAALLSIPQKNTDRPAIGKVLVANRSEIAVRIMRTCQRIGIPTAAVYSDPDKDAPHVRMASEAHPLGGCWAEETYMDQDKLLAIARRSGATAIHPGYGFLSEDAGFAAVCEKKGITFIGSPSHVMRLAGNKLGVRKLAASIGVPVLPGSLDPMSTLEEFRQVCNRVGYPVYLKPAAYSGGGRGIRRVENDAELAAALERAGSDVTNLFVEKWAREAKHIELQILGDVYGRVVALGERECTIQRRNQKLIEESPCARLREDEVLHLRMREAALRLARAVDFVGTGTVEFLLDRKGNFYVIEINCRLQVEHAVTEMVRNIDLVEQQLHIAANSHLHMGLEAAYPASGAAIECRVYAEDPHRNFFPSIGRIAELREPSGEGIRVDSALYPGMEVPPYYDSLLAKVIVRGKDRSQALEKMSRALGSFTLEGVKHTIPYSLGVLDDPSFVSGNYDYSVNGNIRFY